MPRPGRLAIAVALSATASWGQVATADVPVRELTWQAVGSRTVDLQLAGPAGGAVSDVAFSADGSKLFALTARGQLWATSDLGETWSQVAGGAEALREAALSSPVNDLIRPSTVSAHGRALLIRHPYDPRYTFALGKDLYRSSDEGRTWVNLTADGAGSIIGPNPKAIAFSPSNPDLLVVANANGLWRSADGGLSWSGLNRQLPNFPEARFLQALDSAGTRVFLRGIGPAELDAAGRWRLSRDSAFEEWLRGVSALPAGDQQRASPWPLPVPAGWALSYRVWRGGAAVSTDLTACAANTCADPERRYISAFAAGLDAQPNYYAGTSDGHLWVSQDGGRTWKPAMQGFAANGAPVTAILVDAHDSRLVLATAAGRGNGHIFRSTNGGVFWDDISSNLPDAPARAVAANSETGSIYLASDAGVFYTRGDLKNPSPATKWTRLGGTLPQAPVEDLRLDTSSGTLYLLAAGYGVFRTTAPDIADSLRVLNAADLSSRAAAPGGLLTVIGAPVQAARAGSAAAPVLASGPNDSQIQVPFEASGPMLDLWLETRLGLRKVGVPIEAVSPAIFVDSDGTPLVLDAGGGVLLDASRPARAGSQILILATGLGRVRPEWPTGLAAPMENPPATIAPVQAYLDGAPLRVISSTLAAGYIGVYMVRVELPDIVNSGTAELAIGSGDKLSNKVRIFLDPIP
jgi:uncharacterized protein (TIGR03437 family)